MGGHRNYLNATLLVSLLVSLPRTETIFQPRQQAHRAIRYLNGRNSMPDSIFDACSCCGCSAETKERGKRDVLITVRTNSAEGKRQEREDKPTGSDCSCPDRTPAGAPSCLHEADAQRPPRAALSSVLLRIPSGLKNHGKSRSDKGCLVTTPDLCQATARKMSPNPLGRHPD